MLTILRLCFFALLVLATGVVNAQMYRIVGADGKITYSDKAPDDPKQAKASAFEIRSYDGPPVAGATKEKPNWEAILRRPVEQSAALGNSSVVMFSTVWCGYCKKARAYMQSKGIAFSEVDIEKDARGKEEYVRLGGKGVPFFVSGAKTLAGFRESSFDSWLKSSGK